MLKCICCKMDSDVISRKRLETAAGLLQCRPLWIQRGVVVNRRCFTVETDLHDPYTDDFQNLVISFLSKDTSLAKFSWNVFLPEDAKRHTNRQTDRQTDAGYCITSLAVVKITGPLRNDATRCNWLFQRAGKRHGHCMRSSWRYLQVRCATSRHGTPTSWTSTWYVPATFRVVAARALATRVVLLPASTSRWRLGHYMDWPAGPRFRVLDQIVRQCLRACPPSSRGSNATSKKNETANRICVLNQLLMWRSTGRRKFSSGIIHHVCRSYRVTILYLLRD